MGRRDSAVENLRFEIDTLEAQVARLRTQLAEVESSATSIILPNPNEAASSNADTTLDPPIASYQTVDRRWPLDVEDYKRYGRQMIMREIGLEGWIRANSLGEDRKAEQYCAFRPTQA